MIESYFKDQIGVICLDLRHNRKFGWKVALGSADLASLRTKF